MYKVFVNDRPIIFTSSSKKAEDYKFLHSKNILIADVIEKVKVGDLRGAYIYTPNLNTAWQQFCQDYNLLSAGGGLVVNKKKEILFIYRSNKWDLPKGRAEGNESIEAAAMREVREECGVDDLEIQNFLLKTYHLFYEKKQQRLKEVYWFLMHTNYKGKPRPLLKEGIKKAVFKKEEEITEALLNTYTNVKSVIQSYKLIE
ncbi:NUDIX hydrolase [Tenacibaculum sp. M341]|uniref:NUDIX hydrolase n=1 Tax=Tenacibaculum sp. M341 TaxID=2530339 RepID=UPI001FB27E3B|nr:NUDIX domain-containing protein [Tenacibaculum sp. M341]